MTTEELKTVFERIREQTSRKLLKWKPSPHGGLRVDFSRSSLQLSVRARQGETNLYQLNIYNNTGAIIASIDGTFEPDADQKLFEIFANAYESAYEVDATVQDILGSLGSKPGVLRSGFYSVSFTSPQTGILGEGIAIIDQ